MDVDLALARQFEENADWLDVLEATRGCKAYSAPEPLDVLRGGADTRNTRRFEAPVGNKL